MDTDTANPIDLSSEAALELEELKQGLRTDAPALKSLFDLLRTPAPAFSGESVSMLADVRSYAILRDSLRSVKNYTPSAEAFRSVIEAYLTSLQKDVDHKVSARFDEAKRFCLALNRHFLDKQMAEMYSARERSDSRYITS